MDQQLKLAEGASLTAAILARRVPVYVSTFAIFLMFCFNQAALSATCTPFPAAPDGAPDKRSAMIKIPAGRFTMGSNSHYPEEAPARGVSVGAFMISSHEVTNAEFSAFVKATGYVTTAEKPIPPDKYPDLPEAYRVPGAMVFVMPEDTLPQLVPSMWWVFTPGANWRRPSGPASTIEGHDTDPVTQVSWEDAKAYAKWRGHDLPTEAEWEWAARAGGDVPSDDLQPDANIWEGVFPYFDAASDGYHGLAPVGCFKPNDYGLYDMIGNVWEWTEDLYRPSHAPGSSFVEDPRYPQRRVIKGGSWMCSNTYCGRYRPSARQPGDADLGSSHTGFRTVLRNY